MSKKTKIVVIAVLAAFLLIASFGAGCASGSAPAPGSSGGFEAVQEVWDVIFDRYVEKDKIDAAALTDAAIKGMVEALDDPYTTYMDAEMHELTASGFEGSIEGIGAHVGMKEDQLVVIAPIIGSPAAGAGIKAGDVILGVDGQPTSAMSLNEAVLNIRGTKGTAVTLLILHQGATVPEEIEIYRDEIKLPSIFFEMRGDIAYIYIHYFSMRTDVELTEALEEIITAGATGIVLDMRGNPGGVLTAVVDVAGHFLHEGIVVDVVDNEGRHTPSYVEDGGLTTDLPMVVLVDEYSASGSEVLAGALRDNGRATLAGTKTFGKGSVNVLYPLQDGSALYITIARWLTPNGDLIEGEGIEPDIQLEVTGEEGTQWAIDRLRGGQ